MGVFGCLAAVLVSGESMTSTTEITAYKCKDPRDKHTCVELVRQLSRSGPMGSERSAGPASKFCDLRKAVRELENSFSKNLFATPWANVTQEPALLPRHKLDLATRTEVRNHEEMIKLREEGADPAYPYLLISVVTTSAGGEVYRYPPPPETTSAEIVVERCRRRWSDCKEVVSRPLSLAKDPLFRCGAGYIHDGSRPLLDGDYESQRLSSVKDGLMRLAKNATLVPSSFPKGCVIKLFDYEGLKDFVAPGQDVVYRAWRRGLRTMADYDFPHRRVRLVIDGYDLPCTHTPPRTPPRTNAAPRHARLGLIPALVALTLFIMGS